MFRRKIYVEATAVSGDSGGAIFLNGKLAGIVSGGGGVATDRDSSGWKTYYPLTGGAGDAVQAILERVR